MLMFTCICDPQALLAVIEKQAMVRTQLLLKIPNPSARHPKLRRSTEPLDHVFSAEGPSCCYAGSDSLPGLPSWGG
ncbi:hypothetical protein PAXRUDRAFT_412101 [Paxillus rubicundulus Ve08.2h10]|uniref:Uncharacterized protein n=1 Tax=Paxillus rubicundulus Ve08.2h10 TaxID=930991 RepID=A0A0D0E2T6_9AGAM|nr:hypothetical protein PAXRUDRAFT_412101 [Paxillus rubicundulus Ve08.2h10]